MISVFQNQRLRQTIVAGVLVCLAPSVAVAEKGRQEESSADNEIRSGRQPGEKVPYFYSRAVTGPLMNKSVCYVCRNGDRPVVMVLLRKTGPQVERLLQNIDRLVDRYRGEGLRSFGVLLSDDPLDDAPAVQTFAFNGDIDLPLSVAGRAVGTAGCQRIHEEAAVTVVLYREQKVVANHAFRDGRLDVDAIRTVLDDVRRFAQGKQLAEARADSPE